MIVNQDSTWNIARPPTADIQIAIINISYSQLSAHSGPSKKIYLNKTKVLINDLDSREIQCLN